MERVVGMAVRGSPIALRLCVERLLPARAARDRAVDLELPTVAKAADLADAAAVVIDRAAHGDISLSEAKEFMALLEVQRKVIETAELAVRIELLEGAAAKSADGEEEERRPMGFVPAAEGEEDLAGRLRRLEGEE
jgi:hypothetical protein